VTTTNHISYIVANFQYTHTDLPAIQFNVSFTGTDRNIAWTKVCTSVYTLDLFVRSKIRLHLWKQVPFSMAHPRP